MQPHIYKQTQPHNSAYLQLCIYSTTYLHNRTTAYSHDCTDMFYSIDAVNESAMGDVNLYPNPTKDSFTIEAENIQNVMVYNTVGQLVYNQTCEGNSAVINLGNVETGIYMVKVVTADGENVQKVSVIR